MEVRLNLQKERLAALCEEASYAGEQKPGIVQILTQFLETRHRG